MDVFTALKERRSCRNYVSEPVSEDTIEKILEAVTWAPSPLNLQPWKFIVVTNKEVKEKIFSEAERCQKWATGTRINASNLLRALYATIRRASLKDLRWHDLRHTFVTRLFQAGVDIYTVQKLGKWKNITMVMRYAHH